MSCGHSAGVKRAGVKSAARPPGAARHFMTARSQIHCTSSACARSQSSWVVVVWTALLVVMGVVQSAAQTVVNPVIVEFDPSADHNTVTNGTPVLSGYDLGFHLVGAVQPFQVTPLGKPTPAGDGKIRVTLA